MKVANMLLLGRHWVQKSPKVCVITPPGTVGAVFRYWSAHIIPGRCPVCFGAIAACELKRILLPTLGTRACRGAPPARSRGIGRAILWRRLGMGATLACACDGFACSCPGGWRRTIPNQYGGLLQITAIATRHFSASMRLAGIVGPRRGLSAAQWVPHVT